MFIGVSAPIFSLWITGINKACWWPVFINYFFQKRIYILKARDIKFFKKNILFWKLFLKFFWSIDRRRRRKQRRDVDHAKKTQKIVQKRSKTIWTWFKTAWKSLEHVPKISRFRMGSLLRIVLKFSEEYGIWYFNFAPKCRWAWDFLKEIAKKYQWNLVSFQTRQQVTQ